MENFVGGIVQSTDSTVMLDPVAYGRDGKWAVSLWFKPSPSGLAGNQFEYIYSHTNREQKYTTGWEANQVQPLHAINVPSMFTDLPLFLALQLSVR